MKFKRIDAFEMNFEECACKIQYKLDTSGVGEKRLYVGHNEALLDEFFDLNNIESFIFLKKDLQNYLIEARDEYYNPVQSYKNDISTFYEANVEATNAIPNEIIELHFTKKYDSQNRYYLNFKQDGFSSKNYDYFRNIALPRVTKLSFVKIQNAKNNKLYIYIKPFFYIDDKEKIEKEIEIKIVSGDTTAPRVYRKKQVKYRQELLDSMPSCLITSVTEDRILEACHIKPFSKCENEDEQYDIANGLVFTPTYHVLFDLGFISFKDNGEILISPFLSNMNKNRLQLVESKKYRIPTKCAKYLDYHRSNIFNQIPDLNI